MKKSTKTVEWSCKGFVGYKSNTPQDKYRRLMHREQQITWLKLKEAGLIE